MDKSRLNTVTEPEQHFNTLSRMLQGILTNDC